MDQQPEAIAVLEAAIQQAQAKARQHLAQTKGGGQAAQPPAVTFIPASRFEGRKLGYYFGKGVRGLGYYYDPRQTVMDGDDGEGYDEAGEEAGEAAAPIDPEELLRQAEEAAHIDEVQELDARSLKRLAAALDKRAAENLQLRAKHAGDPMKFLDNEVDLLSIVRNIAQAAGAPDLYPVLCEGGTLATLAGLLGHDNTDIVTEVVDVLSELTDADAVEEYRAEAGALVAGLVDANVLELLGEALARLDEGVQEEASAVNSCLAVVEHMVEVDGGVAEAALQRTKLLKWLLARIRRKPSDANKAYAAELLAVLMQGRPANQRRLADANGIDVLLMCINGFKNREPADAEEGEFLENVFDALCSCLLLPEVRASFLQAEGVELMFLLLKAKRTARVGALKALDFATTRYPPAAERFIDAGGLAPLFGLFMGRAKLKPPPGSLSSARDLEQEAEERCLSLVANLFQGLGKGARRDRLAAKFVEGEFEKADRLLELLQKYLGQVTAAEARLAHEIEEEAEAGGDAEALYDDDAILIERMDAGLFHLQQACVVACHLWATGDTGLRRHLLVLLHQRGQPLDDVRDLAAEYYVLLSDDLQADGATGPAADERRRQRTKLAALLAGMGLEQGELEAATVARAAARSSEAAAEGSAPAASLPAAGKANGGAGGEDGGQEDGPEPGAARPPANGAPAPGGDAAAGPRRAAAEEQADRQGSPGEGAERSGREEGRGAVRDERQRGRDERGRGGDGAGGSGAGAKAERRSERDERPRGEAPRKSGDRGDAGDREGERERDRRRRSRSRSPDRGREREGDRDSKRRRRSRSRSRDRRRSGSSRRSRSQ